MMPPIRAVSRPLLVPLLLALCLAGGLAGFLAIPAHAEGTLPVVSIASNQDSVVEGEDATFTLTRTGETTGELTVQVNSAQYNGGTLRVIVLNHTVTFNAGSATAVVTVATIDDGIREFRDWVAAQIAAGSGYIVGDPGRATVTVEDPPLPIVSIVADQTSVAEGEAATFTLNRTDSTANALVASVNVSDPGAFRRGNHWERTPAARITVNFAAGSATAQLSLQTADDWRDIPDNDLTVSVIAGDDYLPDDPAYAIVTVTDNDVAPEVELTLNETSIVEGETLVITFRLHGGSVNLLDVGYVYGFPGQMRTSWIGLDDNEPTLSGNIYTDDDDLDEADRVFEATIIPFPSESLAHVESEYWTVRGPRTVSATVTDDDLPLVYVEQVEEAYEEGTLADLRLVRVGQTARDLDIKYRTSETGHDVFRRYAYLMGQEQTWTIPASSSQADVLFTLQWDDGDEDEGAITLEVLPSSAYRIEPDRSMASFRVIDDDPAPVLSVSGASASEGAGNVEFTVTLEAELASRRAVTVDYATADGTASAADGDYAETSGTLTFAPGHTSRTISVPVNDDAFAERDESFTLTLSNPVNATLLDGVDSIAVTGTIEDDEPLVSVTRRSVEVTEGEPVIFDITRDPNSSRELTVTLFVLKRPPGGFLTTELQTVTFPPNTRTVQWRADTEDDDVDEPDGVFGVLVLDLPLSDPPPAYWRADDRTLFVDILDNDLPTVTIEAAHSDRKEGQDAEFTLTREGDLSVPLTVNVTITGGGDYLTGARPTTATFAEGASSASLSLPTGDDDPVDDDDTLTATVAQGNGYQAGEPATASVSLFDSQRFYPSVSIRANRAVVDEGEDVVFTLTRTGAHLEESLTVSVGVIEKKSYIEGGTYKYRKYGKVVSVEFEPGSQTATLTQPTEDETLNDGNSSFEAEIRLGGYAIRPYPGTATTWVRDDDIPTVTITSATANRFEENRSAPFLVVDGEKIYAEVIETGFEEILETSSNTLGFIISRTGDTSSILDVRTNGYGFYRVPGALFVQFGRMLIGNERTISSTPYYTFLDVQEGEEASFLDPSYETRDLVHFSWIRIDPGRSSGYRPTPPHTVTALGGLNYATIEPFYCQTVPGDCEYQPQYRIGSPGSAAYRIRNNAQGVRVEADREEVTEGGSITFTLHRYGASPVSREAALTVRVQVTQDGEFMDGVPPQTVHFPGYPEESELTATVTVPTIDDLLDEANGAVTLTILPPAAEDIGEDTSNYEPETRAEGDSTWTYQATVRVLDDDEVGFEISDAAADEAAGSIEFTVTLPTPSALETSVDWATAPGAGANPATPGEDYEAAGGALTFAPGETSRTVVVTVLDDDVFEPTETFVVKLNDPSGASLSVPEGTGAIIDDDKPQRVSVRTDSDSFVEGRDVVFRLERCSFVNEQDCTQDEPRGRLELTPTLIRDGDFLLDTSALLVVFEAGSWATTVTLPTVDDDVFEATGFVWLSNAALPGDPDSQAGGISKSVEIHDNDMPVSIVSGVEADEGDRTITFAVNLEEPAVLPVTVDVATVDGTATSLDFGAFSRDFEARDATLTFEPGEQTKEFTVTLVDDRLDEAREEFTVELSNPVNGRIKDGMATGAITDDDEYLTARLIPPAQRQIPEGSEAPALFLVELSHEETSSNEQEVTVDWTVTPGTAAPGEDYVEAGGRVIIPAGQTTGTFEVNLVDDSLFEAWAETFTVTLTGGKRVDIDEDLNSATIQIRDDDSVGVALFADAEHVTEGENATFTVQLTGAETTAPVEVEYETAGNAESGEDYTAPSGTLTIPAGQRFGVITIVTLVDGVVDPDETLKVKIAEVTSLGRPLDKKKSAASVTILDKDESSVSVRPVAPGEGPGTPNEGLIAASETVEGKVMQFTVSLYLPTDAPVDVEWETREYEGDPSPDGRATPDADYTSSSGKVTIPAGDTSTTLNVPTTEDAVFERNELFQVALTGAAKGADSGTAGDFPLGVFSAVGRILDDDDSPDMVLLAAAPKAVAEDAGATEITVEATLPGGANTLAVDTEVSVWVSGGSAAEGEDYTATGATLVILAGESIGTGTLTLTPVDDLFAEGNETAQVSGTATGLQVDPFPITITDNDALPTGVTLKVAPDTVDEGAGATSLDITAAFTDGDARGVDTEVVLSIAGASLTFVEETPNGQSGTTTTTRTTAAASAGDFTAASVTVTIPAGEMQGTAPLTLTPTDDTVAEGNETVQVSGAASGLTVTAAGVTIIDNDTEPNGIELSVTPRQVDEDAGDADLQVTATLTGGGSRTEDTSISLSVQGVTATDGEDYSAPADVTLTIPAGSTTGTATLTLTLINDDLHEGEEQLAVRGSNADPGLPVAGLRIVITDDDAAPTGITLSLDMNRIPEDAGLQELNVTATLEGGSKRTVDTQVMLSVSNLTASDADYSAVPAGLTIDSGQPRGTATMLLVPADDSIDEEDETLEVRGATAELTLPVAAQQVTITDDDSAGVSIDPTELTVTEGGSAGYTVVLDSQPTGDVTVTISGHDGTDVSVTPSSLTFTSENWETPQTVTVSAAEDEDVAPDQAVTLAHAVGSVEDTLYNGIDPESVTVTIEEDDAARVSIDPTEMSVPEGGDNSYTVVLTTQPSADVTVTISGHTGTDLSLYGQTLTNDELTFTPVNWNQAQTVTVSADQDDDAAADPEVTLAHAVSGAGEYASVSAGDIPSVTVTIDEDDSAGVSIDPTELTLPEGGDSSYTVVLDTQPSADVTVTISGHDGTDVSVAPPTLTFTSENWNAAQTVTVSAAQDQDAAADEAVTLSHAVSGAEEYQNVTTDSVTVTIEEDDAARVSIDPTTLTVPEGGDNSYTVVLDTQPTADVTVTINGHDGTDVSVAPSTLTFTSENWGTAQTVTVSAADDPDAATDPAVTLSHTIAGTGEYQNVTAGAVTVTIVEADTSTLSVSAAQAAEDAGEVVFEVTISAANGQAVTVAYATSDGTATAGEDYTATSDTLTFPANSIASQTISVPVTDDTVDEEDETFTLTLSQATVAVLAGGGTTLAVTGTITDNDDPQVQASFGQSYYSVAEGGTVQVTVTLSADPERTVTIPISRTDQGASAEDYTGVPESVSFGSGETSKSFTVTAAQDLIDDDGESVDLSFGTLPVGVTASSDNATATVTITDDDTANVTVSTTALTVAEGGSNSYTVVLDTEPTGDVTITISGYVGTDLTLSGLILSANDELIFTADDWDTTQTVTVAAAQDPDAAADLAVTLGHAVSGAEEYQSVTADDVVVTITEDDTPG